MKVAFLFFFGSVIMCLRRVGFFKGFVYSLFALGNENFPMTPFYGIEYRNIFWSAKLLLWSESNHNANKATVAMRAYYCCKKLYHTFS